MSLNVFLLLDNGGNVGGMDKMARGHAPAVRQCFGPALIVAAFMQEHLRLNAARQACQRAGGGAGREDGVFRIGLAHHIFQGFADQGEPGLVHVHQPAREIDNAERAFVAVHQAVGQAVEGVGQGPHFILDRRMKAELPLARAEAGNAPDHLRNAPGKDRGHPDGDENDQHGHERRGRGQAHGGLPEIPSDGLVGVFRKGGQLLVRALDEVFQGGLGFHGRAVKIFQPGAHGHKAETPGAVAVLAGIIGNGRRRVQLPQAAPENPEGAGPPVSGQVEPAGALRREIQIAAVKAHQAPAGQLGRRFFVVGLGLESGHILDEFGIAFAAGQPFLVNMLFKPGNLRVAGFGIITGDGVMAGMADAAALVVPDEGIIAFKGVRQFRVALKRGGQPVHEFHEVVMVQSKGDVARNRAVTHHRRGPAHKTLEAPAVGIFLAGISLLFRLIGKTAPFQVLGRVHADEVRAHILADDVGNVNFTGFELLELGEIGFRPDIGIAPVGHIFELRGHARRCGHLDAFHTLGVHKGHFEKQRTGLVFKAVGRPVVKTVVVFLNGRNDRGRVRRLGRALP